MNSEVTGLDVKSKKLTSEQREFVLRKIAGFYRLREIVEKFRAEFRDCVMGLSAIRKEGHLF